MVAEPERNEMEERSAGSRASSRTERGQEQGLALLLTVMVLIMITAMALASIYHAGEESTGGRRAKAAMDALYGADAGIELSRNRVAVGDLSAINMTFNGIQVQSRARSETSAQPIVLVGTTGLAGDNMINVGSAIGLTNEIYRVRMTATSFAGSVAEIHSNISYTGPGLGSGSAAGGGY